uniref:Uncharacterized protein n=1 Tax=Ditylenchus dipsaci TaxID=166011 RepID=A0A915CT30_9BILA
MFDWWTGAELAGRKVVLVEASSSTKKCSLSLFPSICTHLLVVVVGGKKEEGILSYSYSLLPSTFFLFSQKSIDKTTTTTTTLYIAANESGLQCWF